MRKTTSLFLLKFLILLNTVLSGQDLSPESTTQYLPVRLKDLARIVEARDNQLLGFGLVVGLRNSGDSKNTSYTHAALINLLSKLGVSPGSSPDNSRNIAGVMVTATLPPFTKKGQRITVTVSSLGDCTSLVGGTLLLTELKGANLRTYAVAQGPILVGGISENTENYKFYKNQTTVGSVPDGGIVENEVPITFTDQHNITIVLNDSNFITVARATKAIQQSNFPSARAIDANTIKIPLTDLDSSDLVNTIAKLENITLVPDSSAKIIINSKTGTVVIGEMVRLFPVALTHGNISVKISEGSGAGNTQAELGAEVLEPVQIEETESKIIYLSPSSTLSSLVNALNEIGATPKDLISIIQALKESGSLIATVEII
ncbi:MAG: flagellar basal body P-ring protein FlgI [bacterium]|nr:flagellar basal body P-ring protein FlgI [bacterium]